MRQKLKKRQEEKKKREKGPLKLKGRESKRKSD